LDESDTTLIIFNFFLALILEKSSNSSCGAVAVRQGDEARTSRL
jgi:hypothetical protein